MSHEMLERVLTDANGSVLIDKLLSNLTVKQVIDQLRVRLHRGCPSLAFYFTAAQILLKLLDSTRNQQGDGEALWDSLADAVTQLTLIFPDLIAPIVSISSVDASKDDFVQMCMHYWCGVQLSSPFMSLLEFKWMIAHLLIKHPVPSLVLASFIQSTLDYEDVVVFSALRVKILSCMQQEYTQSSSTLDAVICEFIFGVKAKFPSMDCSFLMSILEGRRSLATGVIFLHPQFSLDSERNLANSICNHKLTCANGSAFMDWDDLVDRRVFTILAVLELSDSCIQCFVPNTEDEAFAYFLRCKHAIQIDISPLSHAVSVLGSFERLDLLDLFVTAMRHARDRSCLVKVVSVLIKASRISAHWKMRVYEMVHQLLMQSVHMKALVLPILCRQLDDYGFLAPLVQQYLPSLLHSTFSSNVYAYVLCLYRLSQTTKRQAVLTMVLGYVHVLIFKFEDLLDDVCMALCIDALGFLVDSELISPRVVWSQELCGLWKKSVRSVHVSAALSRIAGKCARELPALTDDGRFVPDNLLESLIQWLSFEQGSASSVSALMQFPMEYLRQLNVDIWTLAKSALRNPNDVYVSQMVFELTDREVLGMSRSVFLGTRDASRSVISQSSRPKYILSTVVSDARQTNVLAFVLSTNRVDLSVYALDEICALPSISALTWNLRLFVLHRLIALCKDSIPQDRTDVDRLLKDLMDYLSGRIRSATVVSQCSYAIILWTVLAVHCGSDLIKTQALEQLCSNDSMMAPVDIWMTDDLAAMRILAVGYVQSFSTKALHNPSISTMGPWSEFCLNQVPSLGLWYGKEECVQDQQAAMLMSTWADRMDAALIEKREQAGSFMVGLAMYRLGRFARHIGNDQYVSDQVKLIVQPGPMARKTDAIFFLSGYFDIASATFVAITDVDLFASIESCTISDARLQIILAVFKFVMHRSLTELDFIKDDGSSTVVTVWMKRFGVDSLFAAILGVLTEGCESASMIVRGLLDCSLKRSLPVMDWPLVLSNIDGNLVNSFLAANLSTAVTGSQSKHLNKSSLIWLMERLAESSSADVFMALPVDLLVDDKPLLLKCVRILAFSAPDVLLKQPLTGVDDVDSETMDQLTVNYLEQTSDLEHWRWAQKCPFLAARYAELFALMESVSSKVTCPLVRRVFEESVRVGSFAHDRSLLIKLLATVVTEGMNAQASIQSLCTSILVTANVLGVDDRISRWMMDLVLEIALIVQARSMLPRQHAVRLAWMEFANATMKRLWQKLDSSFLEFRN